MVMVLDIINWWLTNWVWTPSPAPLFIVEGGKSKPDNQQPCTMLKFSTHVGKPYCLSVIPTLSRISLFLQLLYGGFISNFKCLKSSNKNSLYDTDENLKEHPRHVFVLCHSQSLSRQQFFVQNDAYTFGCLWSLIIRQQTRSTLFALL